MSNLVSLPDRRGLVAEVAENVRVECARRGWKQSDLAMRVPVDRALVIDMFTGERVA